MKARDLIPFYGYVKGNTEIDVKYGINPSFAVRLVWVVENIWLYFIIGFIVAWSTSSWTFIGGLLHIKHVEATVFIITFVLAFAIVLPVEYVLMRKIGSSFPKWFGWGTIQNIEASDARRAVFLTGWNSMIMFMCGAFIWYFFSGAI